MQSLKENQFLQWSINRAALPTLTSLAADSSFTLLLLLEASSFDCHRVGTELHRIQLLAQRGKNRTYVRTSKISNISFVFWRNHCRVPIIQRRIMLKRNWVESYLSIAKRSTAQAEPACVLNFIWLRHIWFQIRRDCVIKETYNLHVNLSL